LVDLGFSTSDQTLGIAEMKLFGKVMVEREIERRAAHNHAITSLQTAYFKIIL
jgi:hypothetical protein